MVHPINNKISSLFKTGLLTVTFTILCSCLLQAQSKAESFYDKGMKDPYSSKGVKVFKKSAELSYADAQFYVAASYLKGAGGFEQNSVKAFYYSNYAKTQSTALQSLVRGVC